MHLRNVHSCIQTEFVIDICTMLLLCQCIFVQTSHACVVYVMLCICKYVLCYGPVASISLINYYIYYYNNDVCCFRDLKSASKA